MAQAPRKCWSSPTPTHRHWSGYCCCCKHLSCTSGHMIRRLPQRYTADSSRTHGSKCRGLQTHQYWGGNLLRIITWGEKPLPGAPKAFGPLYRRCCFQTNSPNVHHPRKKRLSSSLVKSNAQYVGRTMSQAVQVRRMVYAGMLQDAVNITGLRALLK